MVPTKVNVTYLTWLSGESSDYKLRFCEPVFLILVGVCDNLVWNPGVIHSSVLLHLVWHFFSEYNSLRPKCEKHPDLWCVLTHGHAHTQNLM